MTNDPDDSSFGAVLNMFRTRRHLSQQQLAAAVGMHRSAISRWEQGDFLPASKTIVLELARQLRLDEQESRRLLEASLTALSPHWLVPFPRNPFFTGREEILQALHAQLGLDQAVALTQSSALHGLGGIGKTQIALEYAYRHALEYRAVFWIGAETEESIVTSLLRIAETLQLPERDEKDQQRVVAVIHRWLNSHGQWLLIWDNVDDLDLLDRFLPVTRSGANLLTTRCQTLGTRARGLDLPPMEQEEGMLFLLRRAKMLEPEGTLEQMRQFGECMPGDYAAASELVTALGQLPLALDQAGAYVETTQCGLSAYLDHFRTRGGILLQQRGEGIRDHPASVSTTFALAVTATIGRHPAVLDLLRVCALLQPDAIPEELFRQGGEHLGTKLKAVCCDALEWDRVVAMACSYSLLSRQPKEHTLSLHRLVQVILDMMTAGEREQWTRRVTAALDAGFPEVLPTTEHIAWARCERLLPHAIGIVHRTRSGEESLPFASLTYKAAQYLSERGRYREAAPLFQRALSIRERILGPEHPEVARILNYLAVLCVRQARYGEAEPLYQRALHIWEHTLGSDHPDVARIQNNLALLYVEQGKHAEAEPLYQRALRISERALGPDHPQVAVPLANLADLCVEQGKYVEAEPLYQRALCISERALGPDHPQVAEDLTNLARLYRLQSRYTEAEPLYQRAIQIGEQALGPKHPELARVLDGLAELREAQGRFVEAETFYLCAWSILEHALGPDHPSIACTQHHLANLMRDQNRDVEAQAFSQRALDIQEQLFGQQHPERAETLDDLAIAQRKRGNRSEALSLAERSLHIRLQSLRDPHLQTTSEPNAGELLDTHNAGRRTGKASLPLPEGVDQFAPANDAWQGFLTDCCELHPRAWCRSADLWQTYQQWAAERQERYPLSRGAFIRQLKVHGCRADRTPTARIWRGIALVRRQR